MIFEANIKQKKFQNAVLRSMITTKLFWIEKYFIR